MDCQRNGARQRETAMRTYMINGVAVRTSQKLYLTGKGVYVFRRRGGFYEPVPPAVHHRIEMAKLGVAS